MGEFEVGLHARADRSLTISTVLSMWLFITIPFALYALFRISRMRVKVTATGFEERGLLVTDEVSFDDIERFGLYCVSTRGDGLLRTRVDDHDIAIYAVFLLRSGKTVWFLANQYEQHFGLLERLAAGSRVQREEVNRGLFGFRWPQKQR